MHKLQHEVLQTFVFYALSIVGHGNSQGDRVHVDSFNTYVQDVVRHIEDMNKQHPEVPSMLLGHSMVSCYYHVLCLSTRRYMYMQCIYCIINHDFEFYHSTIFFYNVLFVDNPPNN